MCFGGSKSKSPDPIAEPEVLEQEAPEKKTAKKADTLSIGTKKYRSESPSSGASSGYPSTSM